MRRCAIICGAGPGLGAALAQRLSSTHHLLLLSRSLPGSLPNLHLDVPEDRLLAATSDGSRSSFDAAMKKLNETWPDGVIDVGIYNPGSTFAPGKFLERKEDDLKENLQSGVYGLLRHQLATLR